MMRPDPGPRDGGHRRTDARLPLDHGANREFPTGGPGQGTGAETGAPTFDTGTTIVAVAAADAVVMAADRRMSLGGQFTANKNVLKVEPVHPTAAMAISGAVGPAQGLLQSLRAETSLYESRRGDPMSMTALSQTAGHLARGLPVTPLLGGVDGTGGHVYELDGGGSVLEDTYAAGGSGLQVAYGVLERRLEQGDGDDPGDDGTGHDDAGDDDVGDATTDPDVETATAAATAAVEAASERDTASGNGVDVVTITAEGVDVADRADGEVA